MKSRLKSILFIMLFLTTGCSRHAVTKPIPEINSQAWTQEVARATGTENQRVGSHEWMMTVGQKLNVYDSQGHGPDPGSEEWAGAVHFKVFGKRTSMPATAKTTP